DLRWRCTAMSASYHVVYAHGIAIGVGLPQIETPDGHKMHEMVCNTLMAVDSAKGRAKREQQEARDSEKRAKQIARALNCHDELLAACKAILAKASESHYNGPEGKALRDIVEPAIAKAEAH